MQRSSETIGAIAGAHAAQIDLRFGNPARQF
jgi:hypothetical protein